MVKVWLDAQPEDSNKKFYISLGDSPPPVPSAEQRYKLLGVISGNAQTKDDNNLSGYVTKEQVLEAISQKRKIFEGHINHLDELESKITSIQEQ